MVGEGGGLGGRKDRGRRVELTSPPLDKKVTVERAFGAFNGPVSLLRGSFRRAKTSRTPVHDGVLADLVVALPLTGAYIVAPTDVFLLHVLPR